MWLVFVGIGVLVYRFAKKLETSDSSKIALGIISFLTLFFLAIAGVKYSDVQKDKFIEELGDMRYFVKNLEIALPMGILINYQEYEFYHWLQKQ